MAKTAAEKQREYRARRDADPARRQSYLQRERAAWYRKKETKQWKPMAELSSRDQRRRRRYNRAAQRRYRKRVSDVQSLQTPPETPSSADAQPGPSR